jgi:hypothetical protein
MKKFYAFFAAALISVSAFASKDQVPSDQVLADYYEQGNVCACFFVPADMNCYDIVVTGSFNGWSDDLTKCVPVEAVEGFDGWYVASWEPEAEPDASKGIQAKPVMKDALGAFDWNSQVGTATKIRGGVEVVAGTYEGQIDLINYGTDAPNVFTVDTWLKNPCTAVFHNYKIVVINDGCDGFAIPAIAGSFNGWKFAQMQVDQAKTIEYGAGYYYYNVKAAEGAEFQLASSLMDAQGQITDTADWKDIAYLQELENGIWKRYNNGNNCKTGEEAEIVFDIRNDTLQWARCDNQPEENTYVRLLAPAGAPAKVEIIGEFGAGWSVGTEMEHLDNGQWFVNVQAKAGQLFKFRSGVGETDDDKWANQIVYYVAENDDWYTFGDGNSRELRFGQLWVDDTYKGEKCKYIELDFSDGDEYKWQIAGEEGIEEIVLTEKAHKVVVDGVIYIVRDNKMFNLQGAQVR